MAREAGTEDVPPAWVTAGAIEAPGDQLHQILDALPLLLWTASPEGLVESCNDRWCEYTGLGRAQTVGTGWKAALHPEDLAATEAAVAGAFGRLVPYQVEQRLRRHDGQYRWFLVRGTPVRDPSGRVVRWGGANLDIHDRKVAEEALRESELRLAPALEGSDLGAWDWDVGSGVLNVSRRWREIVDAGPDEPAQGELSPYPSERWVAAIHPEDAPATVAAASRLVEGTLDRYDVEYRLRLRDGGWRWVRSNARALQRAPGGGAARIAGVLADITASKAAEAERLALAQRHQSILQSSMDGFWLTDLEGRIVEVNEAYCRMTGYTAGELLRLRVGDLEAVESPEETAAHLAKVMAQGRDRFESRHRRKDGALVEVEVSIQRAPGAPHIAVFVRDVTERRRAEAERARLEGQLVQAQKMESVGRLAGGIAHDFNNMLGVILGHAALALEQLAPDQPLRADLEEIQAAAKRSADLTRQLLAFARKQAIRPVVLDLNAAVAGMLRLLQRILGEDIALDWRPDPALWPTKADPSQIDQVLANLCANARDAIAGVGRLTIETGNATFDAAACAARPEASPGDWVRLAVTDTGGGMDAETLGHLFEPFFTTKAVGKGTGLGLATIYGIVKQSEGFVTVRSAPGRGTTFEVFLPRHAGQARAGAAEPAAGPAPRGHETVLAVEDEPGILAVTRRMLGRQGYQVLTAAGPEEALALAGRHPGAIDVLVSDVIMPGMNGPDLAARLQALRPGLRVIFMSGYPANIIAHHGAQADGPQFLQKPFGALALAAAVRAALERG